MLWFSDFHAFSRTFACLLGCITHDLGLASDVL